MIAERWQAVEALYHAALEQPFDQRAAFVLDACKGDADLQGEVSSLLKSHDQTGSFIEESIAPTAAAIFANDQVDPLLGQQISHYKVLSFLGKGGMGDAYLAEDTTLHRKVALKLFDPELVGNNDTLERFMREARLASSLDHPNICTVYEAGETEGRPFIAMRYVHGKTLKQLIDGKPLSVESLLSIAFQIGDALAGAHAHGIIHRDIKSENIMVTSDGRVQVLDFGIAKLLEESDKADPHLTLTGRILGTPTVMSPEQARGDRLDVRSDIFSFGVVLYEMATGRLPFVGKSKAEVISALLKEPQIPARDLNSKISPTLSGIIDRALAKEAERRFQFVEEMIETLRRVSSEKVRHVWISRAMSRQLRWVALVTGFVLLAAVAAFLFRFVSHQPTSLLTKSIAVLPLDNLSGDPNNAYFAEGVQDEILTRLAKVPELKVISRTSTQRFKSAPADLRRIAEQLGVMHIVEGSVQRANDQVRVNVQLINATNDAHLWAETYDRKLTDIFAVESEIANTIAERLEARLTNAQKSVIAKAATEDTEAHDLYLKGRFFWNKRTPDNFTKAVGYFQQAIEKDPHYALAYSGLADCYALLADYEAVQPREIMPKAKAAAIQALQIDPNLAEAHASLAQILHDFDWDFAGSLREVDRAIELNPNYATAHQWKAEFLSSLARHGEALAESKRALELDPLSMIINRIVGEVYLQAGRFDEAIDQFRKTVEIEPNSPYPHFVLMRAYIRKRMYTEAVEEHAIWTELASFDGSKEFARKLRAAYKAGGYEGWLRSGAASLEVDYKGAYPYDIAVTYALLGEKDQALAWLEKAYSQRDHRLALITVTPEFDSIRSDPRFADLVRRVGLPQ